MRKWQRVAVTVGPHRRYRGWRGGGRVRGPALGRGRDSRKVHR